MLVTPGTHSGPVWSHHGEDGRFAGLIDPDLIRAEIDRAVPCIGRAGSMSFHHVRALHGSALNTSDRPRNLLLYEVAASDAWPLMGVKDFDEFNSRLLCGALGRGAAHDRRFRCGCRCRPPRGRGRSTRRSRRRRNHISHRARLTRERRPRRRTDLTGETNDGDDGRSADRRMPLRVILAAASARRSNGMTSFSTAPPPRWCSASCSSRRATP